MLRIADRDRDTIGTWWLGLPIRACNFERPLDTAVGVDVRGGGCGYGERDE